MIDFKLRAAEPRDVPAIVGLISELAAFEHLSHLLRLTPDTLAPHLFGERPVVEAVVADALIDGQRQVVAFALFFMMRGGTTAEAKNKRMARALALRVGFSVLLFICILVAWKAGIIQPTGIPQGK